MARRGSGGQSYDFTINGYWNAFLSGLYLARISNAFSVFIEVPRTVLYTVVASRLAISSQMYFTSLPSNALSPLAVVLLRPLYVLAFLEAFISQASTITAIAAISKKEMTRTRAIVFFSLTTIGIVVAAVVLALQSLLMAYPSDVQAVLMTRSDLSSE